jgi:hypothetical protein
VASVCIAFRYDADAMHRFFDAIPMQCIAFLMRYRYMVIYRIASHRFTVDSADQESWEKAEEGVNPLD